MQALDAVQQETGNTVGGLLEGSVKEITAAVNTSDQNKLTEHDVIKMFMPKGSAAAHGNSVAGLWVQLINLCLPRSFLFCRPCLPLPALTLCVGGGILSSGLRGSRPIFPKALTHVCALTPTAPGPRPRPHSPAAAKRLAPGRAPKLCFSTFSLELSDAGGS